MFCPNCGTKNQDAVEKCTQCGFDLEKKAAPRFKGTMMAGASPFANQAIPGGPSAPASPAPAGSAGGPTEAARASAAMKGTMVGVAPPNIAELRKQMESVAAAQETASAAPKPSAAMKGTMVGVAPPGIEELRKQMAQASAPAEPLAPQQTAPAQPAVSKPQLKGTMIGVAPPNIAELRKQLDSQNAATATPATTAEPKTSAPAPQVSAPAGASGTPSKLKGTMIGVAPPDVSALLAKGKAADASNTPTEPAPAPTDPSDTNPADAFGGTVVGTSPFAPGGQFADKLVSDKQADSGNTVPSPSPEEGPVPERRSDRPEAFAATRISEPPIGGSFDDRTPAAGVAPNGPSAVTYSPPKSKNSNSAVVVLGIAVVAIIAIVAFLVTR